ncbi:hypothetical protein DFJ43DRAFT_238673 [Lentinula guzmanii]|uniref:Uncharacterized protein n=1 Tax=Lentinula guzmanii TaxID=2804957 RepID=A0AA38JDA9_9AGAR|nr:hypothetical protein DFJ43DRAFT_238673 [Lentinula guzmanii]
MLIRCSTSIRFHSGRGRYLVSWALLESVTASGTGAMESNKYTQLSTPTLVNLRPSRTAESPLQQSWRSTEYDSSSSAHRFCDHCRATKFRSHHVQRRLSE